MARPDIHPSGIQKLRFTATGSCNDRTNELHEMSGLETTPSTLVLRKLLILKGESSASYANT